MGLSTIFLNCSCTSCSYCTDEWQCCCEVQNFIDLFSSGVEIRESRLHFSMVSKIPDEIEIPLMKSRKYFDILNLHRERKRYKQVGTYFQRRLKNIKTQLCFITSTDFNTCSACASLIIEIDIFKHLQVEIQIFIMRVFRDRE